METLANPSHALFGGKGFTALPWRPLPYMDEYLADLASDEKARSVAYRRAVRVGLSRFAAFATTADVRHPDEITRTIILRFQADLVHAQSERGLPLAPGYQRQLMRYVRGWINWLGRRGYVRPNPWRGIKLAAAPRSPNPLDDGELDLMFSTHRRQAFSAPPFAFHRRELLLVLFFACGLRPYEIETLTVDQMTAFRSWVTVRSSSGGPRTVPYDAEVKASVHRWLTHRATRARPDEDALLIDDRGGGFPASRMRRIVLDCAQRAGLAVTPDRLNATISASAGRALIPAESITWNVAARTASAIPLE